MHLTLSLLLLALAARPPVPAAGATTDASASIPVRGTVALNQPVAVYNNWSAYDELSDTIELTEGLAMQELDQIVRLRRAGVRLDYYLMDAFWYSTNGGYREFRHPHWPNGPDRWLNTCRDRQIKPGLWFPSNVPFRIAVLPEWRSSLDATGSAMCLFDGGFLPQFVDTLQFWYDRGVRLFKFDFANFTIATPDAARRLSKPEIYGRNCDALRQAILHFKQKNRDAMFAAFNGFGGDTENEGTFAPVRTGLDLRWLQAFDSLYCGDPRLSDVPARNFWRSMDLYSDHMVRYFAAAGAPLERIDNTGCMLGVAGTCYGRRTEAWKSLLLLEHARGGWMNVYYGNLELLSAAQARWFAKVQALYLKLQSFGRTYPFGPMPGEGRPYGFCSLAADGALYTVANPSQAVSTVRLPTVHRLQQPLTGGRIQFRDAGFAPKLAGDHLRLGPEQLVTVGYGEYAKAKYDLGVQEDVVIPQDVHRLAAEFLPKGTNAVVATLPAPKGGDVRVVMQQFAGGKPLRTSRGAPPNGVGLGKILQIQAWQNDRPVPVAIHYDKPLWSGLSWAVGEMKGSHLKRGLPLTIRCVSRQEQPVELKVELYEVGSR